MSTSLYIVSAEAETGKSTIALGVLRQLTRRVRRVAVFRPVVRESEDYVLRTLVRWGGVANTYEEGAGVTYRAVHDNPDAALATIVDRFGELSEAYDAVLVVGSDFSGVANPTELAFNARVAANLGTPVLLVVGGQRRTPDEIRLAAEIAAAEIAANYAKLFKVIANRVDRDDLAAVEVELRRMHSAPDDLMVAALPSDPLLSAPTVHDLMTAVDGRLISGVPELMGNESLGVLVAAMSLPNVLPRLYEGATVVVAADRGDVVLGVVAAHASATFPSLAAVIVNGGNPVDTQVNRLVTGLETRLPIISTRRDTYDATSTLSAVRGRLTVDSRRKVERAKAIFRAHVDGPTLLDRLNVEHTDVVTPLMFEHRLVDAARAERRRIVLPEATDERILRAAGVVLRRDIADLVLLGDPAAVRARALQVGADIEGAEILDPADPALRQEFAEVYAHLRRQKNIPLEVARDRVGDVSYFGTMLVMSGRADGMVSGAAHTTAHTIRPALELLRDTARYDTVSSCFFMCLQDRVLVYADCAIVPDPTSSQLADIAIASSESASAFGVEPRVALLSYSTGESGSGSDVDKVRAATELVRKRRPDIVVEGPIQYDAAVDPGVGHAKLPGSPVAGRATVLVFPDLNTGNNTYKAVQRSAGAVAIGPMLQGLRRAVNDLSRGATVEDIVHTIALTSIQSSQLAHAESAAAP